MASTSENCLELPGNGTGCFLVKKAKNPFAGIVLSP